MAELIVENMRDGYVEICQRVLKEGHVVSPRGMKTREILPLTIHLLDPTDALPIGVGRKLNTAIASAEALQLIGGVSDPALMSRITTNFDRFKNGGSFDGAYGPRIRHQLPQMMKRLKSDRDSRQAIISIWDAAYDLFREDSLDYPCTLTFHFLIRDDRLVMHTHMRSNDVWWGLAHDAYQFAQLFLAVSNELNIEPGVYHHHVTSMHAYERDWPAIEELAPTGAIGVYQLGLLAGAQARARELLRGAQVGKTEQEWWHIRALSPYV